MTGLSTSGGHRDLQQLIPTGGVAGTFSMGIANAPHVSALLNTASIRLNPKDAEASDLTCIVGWGRKSNTARAQLYAAKHHLPYLILEDGMIRSVDLGLNRSPAYGLVVDDLGIYYDASRPSRLESLLQSDGAGDLSDRALIERAEDCMARCVASHISKYNSHSLVAPELPPASGRKRVLLVDQTAGDLSLKLGGLDTDGLRTMVDAAVAEHPHAQLVLKTHPDMLTGKKRSALLHLCSRHGFHVVDKPCDPHALIKLVDHVYVATSQLGFEALLHGKPVTCFGSPYYSGWGLTDDRLVNPRRTTRRTLSQVFAATYLRYSRYLNPESGEPGTLEDVIAHMERQRAMFYRNKGSYICVGFWYWKRDFVRAYLRSPDGHVQFSGKFSGRQPHQLRADAQLVTWGERERRQWVSLAAQRDCKTFQMEDGFLRSVGLGSDLTVPASLVLDRTGIYYDSTRPSDLESILQNEQFSKEELERAADLRASIVQGGISKYNVGNGSLKVLARPGQQIVLVPGQVESDASIRLGCTDIRDNISLLAAVRHARPDSHIIYKPHPDVVFRNRRGSIYIEEARTLCDQIVTDSHIHHCLAVANEVHAMTSLVGFEALLRRLPVVLYGQPFYGGWGLTSDRHFYPRRTRRLSLDMLVAGALIRYPRYIHPETLEFISPEGVIAYLAKATRHTAAPRRSLALRQLQRLARALQGAIHAR